MGPEEEGKVVEEGEEEEAVGVEVEVVGEGVVEVVADLLAAGDVVVMQ